jgi:hypothetical protein
MPGGWFVVREPQEIEDEEHEQVVGRVAAIDVAKASGMVCTRVPHDKRPGQRLTKVWEVQATTNAIIELGDHLACQGIERVVIESTSDYWRPFFYLLESRGLQIWLVNARDLTPAQRPYGPLPGPRASTTTPAASTPGARPATISANSKPSVSRSPSKQPDHGESAYWS